MQRTLSLGTGARPIDHAPWALAGVLCLALLVRVVHLGHESIWADEAFTWWWTRQPLAELWGPRAALETNPPLYYSIAWLATRLLGNDELALRLPPALIGTLTVAATFWLGRTIAGNRVGGLAALLAALAAPLVFYAQEARGYALLCLLGTVAVQGCVMFFRAATPPQSALPPMLPGLALYAASTTAALYVHNTAALLPALLNLVALCWWIGCSRHRASALPWLGVNVAILLAWSWWLPVVVHQASDSSGFDLDWLKQPSLASAGYMYLRLYGLSYLLNSRWLQLASGIPVFAAAVYASVRYPSIGTATLGAVVVGVPALLFLAGLAGRPVWAERTYFWPLPLGLVLIACTIVHLPSPSWRRAALAVMLALSVGNLALLRLERHNEPYRAAMSLIASDLRPGDAILFVPQWAVMGATYYQARLGLALDAFVIDPVEQRQSMGMPYDALALQPPLVRQPSFLTLESLPDLARTHRRLWVLYLRSNKYDPRQTVRGQLDRVGRIVRDTRLEPSLDLALYDFAAPSAVVGRNGSQSRPH